MHPPSVCCLPPTLHSVSRFWIRNTSALKECLLCVLGMWCYNSISKYKSKLQTVLLLPFHLSTFPPKYLPGPIHQNQQFSCFAHHGSLAARSSQSANMSLTICNNNSTLYDEMRDLQRKKQPPFLVYTCNN